MSQADIAGARFAPWIARFRRTGRGEAELELERVDGAPDPRASEAALDGLKIATRGTFFERSELARELGLESTPDCDAELVLHAYKRWGQEGIRRLRGVFDVFIWDGRRDLFLAARDHLGAEPLFYARAGEEFLFSASPTTLVEQRGVPHAPNRVMLVETLQWRFPVPEDTCLEGVRRVLPGHVLAVTNGSATSTRYWNPLDDLQEQGWVEADELDKFDQLLERSVSQCLDLGPSGIFLSGGFDSVSIAAVAVDLAERRGLAKPWALSIAFPTEAASEEHVQRGVAQTLGLPQLMLGLEESIAPDGLVRRALDVRADWPLPRAYLWSGPYQELARAGAEHGTRVIMTGAGGDEWLTVDLRLAADFIQALQFGNLYRFTRSKLGSFATPTAKTLRFVLWDHGLREVLAFHTRALLLHHAPALLQARRRRALAHVPWLAPDPSLRAQVRERSEAKLERDADRPKAGGRFQYYASDGGMVLDHPEISAQREDEYETGRRTGIEFMHPYWEPDLISFLYRVPPELLIRDGLEKGLVRSAIARRFPNFGFERQKKVVAADYHHAMVRRDGPDAIRRLGGCRRLVELGVVDGAQVGTALDKAWAGSDLRELHLAWELLNMETWLRQVA